MQEQDHVFHTVMILSLSPAVHESLQIPSRSCHTQKQLTLCVCSICVDLFHTSTFINHIIIDISTFTPDIRDLMLYGIEV